MKGKSNPEVPRREARDPKFVPDKTPSKDAGAALSCVIPLESSMLLRNTQTNEKVRGALLPASCCRF